MKILVADAFSKDGLEEMKKMGHDVVYEPKVVGPDFVKKIAEVAPILLVVRSKKVTKEVIDADPKLEMIIRAGAGVDTIDVAYAASKGIYVCNCPGKNAVAVAELAIGLMVSLDRKIPENVGFLKENKWEKGRYAECLGLKGRTLGLLGIGFVGKEVAKRAIAFDMKVLAWDIFLTQEEIAAMGAIKVDSAEIIAKEADVVSLHVPSVPATKGMINEKFLSLMKPDAVLINTARADLCVEADLLNRLDKVPGFYYGTDVLPGEPAEKKCAFDSKLGKHPKVFATHHIGASTVQAETAIGIEAVRMVKEYGATKKVNNCVNLATNIKETHLIVAKYESKVGVLGSILAELTKFNLKIEELKNEVFKERKACCAEIHFSGDIAKKDELMDLLKKISGIIDLTFVC